MYQNFKKKLEKFNLDDRTALKAAGKVLVPHLGEVLSRFYERALADPEHAAFFANDGRVTFARNAQQKHWELLFSGEFSDAYVDSAERIGRTHARINLPLETYLSAYACAGSDLVEVLLSPSGRSRYMPRARTSAAQVAAVTRAMMLDIELVVDVTFAAWGEEQTRAFSHLGAAIDALAAGNLSHQIPSPQNSDFPQEYDGIREQINRATADLGALIGQLDTSITDLLGRLTDITNATEDLSSRTTSQSATLEETAAAMAQLTASINASAEKTRETSTVGHKARQDVQHGATVIGEASHAMGSIQKSSESIANITAAIDDVAFQTNLLALNAGVEAARAGDAGRGFAVVASEVRSLALRSSDAAKDIKGLITTSGQSVDQGATLIGRAEAAFHEIVQSFDQVSSLTEAVANAFEEQSLGITEINTSIHEMDRTTQLNANMVEETLVAMQDMRNQASAIRKEIAGLQFNNTGIHPSRKGSDGDTGPLLLTA